MTKIQNKLKYKSAYKMASLDPREAGNSQEMYCVQLRAGHKMHTKLNKTKQIRPLNRSAR